MEITYLGHASFRIKMKAVTVVVDPFDEMVGWPYPKAEAEIVLSSHDHGDHNAVSRVKGTAARPEPLVINAPGEYEIAGVSVFGFKSFHDEVEGKDRGKNTIFKIVGDDLTLVHLGDLGHELSSRAVEALGNVNILMVPVGGVYTIGPQRAAKVVEAIEPMIVIPMHFRAEGMSQTFSKLAGVEDFLKEIGEETAPRLKKLTVVKGGLPEDREVVVLERV